PPGQPASGHDRYFVPVPIEPDTTTVEQCRCVVRGVHAGDCTGTSTRARSAKVERALILEEELALFGKEQAESGEIDLLLVGFNLREVGVVREICGEALRDAVFHIPTEIAAEVAGDSRLRDVVTPQGRDAVRLDR